VVFTALKLLAIALVAVVGLAVLVRDINRADTPAYTNFHGPFAHSGGGFNVNLIVYICVYVNPNFVYVASSLGQVGLAVLAGLWSYDGWNSVNYVTEELVDPQRTLPRSVLLGLPLVTLWCGKNYVLV
jgi:amino acid transporter